MSQSFAFPTTLYLVPGALQALSDVSVNPDSGQNGYPLVWNNDLGKWEASNNIAGVTIRAGAGANSQAIGNTDANSSGAGWIAQGFKAGELNQSGGLWIAQGYNVGIRNTFGSQWIAQGVNAGLNNTIGSSWIAQGVNAGAYNTDGSDWIAQGVNAGGNNTIGSNWVAQGISPGSDNVNGSGWIAQGTNAGQSNTGSSNWIAQGFNAGQKNTLGSGWIAQGTNAGQNNIDGSNWTAQGANAGRNNSGGSNWIAIGSSAGQLNEVGSGWVALGCTAGYFDTRSNVLNIANTETKSLICGNFANNCIYFGHPGTITSSPNTLPTPTAAVHAAASNTTRASLRIDSGVAPTNPNTGDIWVNSTNNSLNFELPLINLQGTQVLTTRRPNWTAPTGTATRASFDTATVTTTQLAERLKALIDDLITHGLIGA